MEKSTQIRKQFIFPGGRESKKTAQKRGYLRQMQRIKANAISPESSQALLPQAQRSVEWLLSSHLLDHF